MLDKIYDINDNLLADVNSIVPDKRSTKVISQLLNGKSLIQIIGDPQQILHVICYAALPEKKEIDDIFAYGKTIKAIHNNEVFLGYIETDIYWETFVERPGDEKIFIGTFDIVVNE